MNIHTRQIYPGQWTAIDDDTYDGAPDAGSARAMGLGNTEDRAIRDLLMQFEEGSMNTADILRAARKLVEQPEGWTRKRYDNSDGFGCDATCFCMAGAVWHAMGLDPMEEDGKRNIPLEYLQLAVGARTEGQLILWNDELNRTHAEVLAAFDRAIELAELSLSNLDEHLIGGMA